MTTCQRIPRLETRKLSCGVQQASGEADPIYAGTSSNREAEWTLIRLLIGTRAVTEASALVEKLSGS
jgi:hypothetical protein